MISLLLLYKKAQQLNKGKEITSTSIIDKLSQYTTEDTYGDNPPKSFMGINGLAGKADEDNAKHHNNKNNENMMKNPDEVPYASHIENNDELPEAKLRKYIDRYGLSGVLSKTGMPDMMTLYKKLSKDDGNDVSPEVLRKINANANHRYHQPHEIKKLKHESPRPISIEYDHVTDETSNHDWMNTESSHTKKGPIKTFEAYWSPPKPISRNIQNDIVASAKTIPIDEALNSDGIKPETSNSFINNNVNFQQQPQQFLGNKDDLHWQMYRGVIRKQPVNVDNTRRDSFPGNPMGGYGYLGDSQQSYVDYSQIFPNSLKRKRRALVGDEKELRDFFVNNDDSLSELSENSPNMTLDDDYINVIGTAELQEIPSKGNSPKRTISVKAYPSEIRSPSFSYKFDTTGYGLNQKGSAAAKRVFNDRSFPIRKADDSHFLVTKQRVDVTNMEEQSDDVKNNKNKVKANAGSSANVSNNKLSSSPTSSASHSKVTAEVSVQKCGIHGHCETIIHPDNNPDTFNSKAGSSVMNEHEFSRPLSVPSPTALVAENTVAPQHRVDFQPPTGQPQTTRPATSQPQTTRPLITKPLPPPPDSELPVDDESNIEPEHAQTTPKPRHHRINKIKKPSSSSYKAQSSVQLKHGGNSHSVQNMISVSSETPTDSQSQGKTHNKDHSMKISNEVKVKTSNKCCEGSQHLISITVVNKTISLHSKAPSTSPLTTTTTTTTKSAPKTKHPAEIEKIEVENTPTPATTTTSTTTIATTPTTTTTSTTTSIATTTTATPAKQPGLFIYDRKIPATESASMFGGDILLVVDITEELLVHAQKQDDAPAIQEVEVFRLSDNVLTFL